MSVKLEWEIDDVEAPLPDSDTETEPQTGGGRLWWRFLAILTLIAVAGLVFLGLRVRQKRQEIENELRAVAELELNAFLKGDRDLFLNQQDPDDRSWRQSREEAFDQYHWQTSQPPWDDPFPVLAYTGGIPIVRVDDDQGWALVEVARGERARRELWFYEWTQADGWRHAELDEDWLGEEKEHSTSHLHFAYFKRDEPLVIALADEMDGWYEILASLFDVDLTLAHTPTVEFEYRRPTFSGLLQVRWDGRNPHRALAPSPHQMYLSTDGNPSPELRQQLAGYLVDVLMIPRAGSQSPLSNSTIEVSALRDELRDWAVAYLARDASSPSEWNIPPTPLVDDLVARKGVEIIPRLAASLAEAETLKQALAAAGLDPPDPVMQLDFVLAAANRAYYAHDDNGYRALTDPQADRAWRQRHAGNLRWRRGNTQMDNLPPPPSPLQIQSVVFNDPIAWVETETMGYGDVVYRQTLFLRRVDDRWLLTAPDPSYFGERHVKRTENLVFEYFEADASWLDQNIHDELQRVFSQVAGDLALATDDLVITVTYELEAGANGWFSKDARVLQFTSPSLAGWSVDHPDDHLFQMSFALIGGLFESLSERAPDENLRYYFTLSSAFIWELDRLFPERIDWDELLGTDNGQLITLSLTDLWVEITPASQEEQFEQIWAGYRTLVEYLVETYGPDVVPALLDNALQTDDLDTWLRLSTGDGLEVIEPAWQVWVSTTYGEP